MPVSSEFEKAAAAVTKFSKKPPDDVRLEIYSLYKQGLQNPPFDKAPAPKGWSMDFAAKPKYEAWKKVHDAGITPAEAQKRYVELYHKIKSDYE